MEELAKGVVLRRAGTELEGVTLKSGVGAHLLAAWDGAELTRVHIPPGKRFGFRPQEGWNALECLYLLEGEVRWESGERQVTMAPGDYIAATPVGEPFSLKAVSDATLLYYSSQPGFHLFSDYAQTVSDLCVSVEEKDGYTRDHCRRIRDFSLRMTRELKLSTVQEYHIYHGAFLHDLGKIAIPDAILKKPGPLTPDEWAVMKMHPVTGGRMLAGTVLAGAAYILEQHHERLDGSGYPLGLSGDQISVEAQIVAVADSFDAMTTDRVYRPALPASDAVAEILRCSGRLFRPDVVAAFLKTIDD